MINLHAIHQPICLRKHLRVLLHILLTSIRLRGTRALSPDFRIPRPLPTERRIKQYAHLPEMLFDVALPSKRRHGRPPRARVRALHPRRDLAPRERPDLDPLARHLRRHHRAPLRIERRAVAPRRRVLDLASGVLVLRGVTDIAITGGQASGEARLLDAAPGVGMQRHAVVARIVDPLQDIDLPVRGPRPAAEHPERGPDAADAARHVRDVGDEEAFVVGFLAGDADGGAAGGGLGGAVDADVDGVGGLGRGADELERGGAGLRVEFDEARGGVGVGEEVEGGEEVAGGVGVEEGVGARPACEEEEGGEGGGGAHVGGYGLWWYVRGYGLRG